MSTQRESGFYWVKNEYGWHIAQWTGDVWFILEATINKNIDDGFAFDDDFEQINENRILAPDEEIEPELTQEQIDAIPYETIPFTEEMKQFINEQRAKLAQLIPDGIYTDEEREAYFERVKKVYYSDNK